MTDREEPATPAMTYDPSAETIVNTNGHIVAQIDPDGGIEIIEGADHHALGRKMAAADVMYDALASASGFLVEKFGPLTRRFDRSMWINQTAFGIYEKINAALQQADGE